MRLHRAIGLQAPDEGRGLELHIDPLRTILEEPAAQFIGGIVAANESQQLFMLDK
ncbi:hypothetical protein D3C85_1874140 [compost metagenome]